MPCGALLSLLRAEGFSLQLSLVIWGRTASKEENSLKSDEEEDLAEASDSEDSQPAVSHVSPGLACEVCNEPDHEEVMLVCDECSKGFHTHCMQPPLTALPPAEQDWFCSSCSEQESSRDNTQDQATLDFLANGIPPVENTTQEKARICAKARRYLYKEGQLFHKLSSKPIPPVADRHSIIHDTHVLGYFAITRTAWLVQKSYWWWGLRDQVKAASDGLQSQHAGIH